jgi:hypothetical protein
LLQRGERLVRDFQIAGKLARGLQDRPGNGIEGSWPSGGLVSDRADIVVADVEVAADPDVVRILVSRAGDIADLKDRQLP